MFPLFLAGDILTFDRKGPFCRGDVVVYRQPGAERYIIHRIISARGEMVRTGCDTNDLPDPYTLSMTDIIGKVTTVTRNGEDIRVSGNMSGYLRYLYLTRYQHQVNRLSGIIRPICHPASNQPVWRNMKRRLLQYRFHIIIQANGSLIGILLIRHWYAAWIHERDRVWQIRPPFHLLIDESDLPDLDQMVRESLRCRSILKNNP